MSNSTTALALALSLPLSALPQASAAAQQSRAEAPAPAPEQRAITLSKQAFQPVRDLEAAVNARDSLAIASRLAAARAAARTADDRFMIANLELKAASVANDEAAMAAAIEAILATGVAAPDQNLRLSRALAELQYKAGQFDKAAASFERVLALEPGNDNAMAMLVETRAAQGRSAEAVALLGRAIAARAAAGGKADEKWYRRAVAIAVKAELPTALEASRQWVAAYPAPASWRDALLIYRQQSKLEGQAALDVLRLARAAGALRGDADYGLYMYEALDGGTPGEAKSLWLEAVAAGAIDPAKPPFAELDRAIRMAAAGESVNLAKKTAAALAGAASGPVVAVADSHFGRGDYARAAELYRQALTRSGADSDLVNLHLGMALARSGDKAGATAALNAVGGARSELARYWLVFVSTLA